VLERFRAKSTPVRVKNESEEDEQLTEMLLEAGESL